MKNLQILELTKNVENFNINHRKEKYFKKYYSLLALIDGKITNIAQIKVYETNKSSYACLWVHGEINITASGYSNAMNTNQNNDAFEQMIKNAKIKLNDRFSKYGNFAIREFLTALAVYLGHENSFVDYSCS